MLGLAITLLLGFFLRIVGINWDQGLHLHPDERMLIMVADRIQFFNQLNPQFFNYGSLPIYLVSGVTAIVRLVYSPHLSNYDLMLYVGRGLSLFADLGCIVFLYLLGRQITRSPLLGLFAGLIYAISFFPIQNTHFFIVDTFLNFFILASLYVLIRYVQKPTHRNLVYVALVVAAAITTKFTSVLLIPFVLISIAIRSWMHKKRQSIIPSLRATIIFTALVGVFSFLCMPYAFLDWKSYIHDVSQQLQLNNNPYAFPYTLQYVGSIPYLYQLQQIVFWGLGPIISALSIVGLLFILSNRSVRSSIAVIILLAFYGLYFMVIGHSSVKFMRYMLPLYPLFALLSGYTLSCIFSHESRTRWINVGLMLMLGLALTWTVAFNTMYIYSHTRIDATRWILQMIPNGSTIAVEHWDDRLPLIFSERYHIEELQLYNVPDDTTKWRGILSQLERTDYIVIASNRLSTPLQRLSDCKKYRACYPLTAAYYRKLFSNRLPFRLVKQFSVSPTLRPFGIPISFSDQYSDESFTVYDHPSIFIFQKL